MNYLYILATVIFTIYGQLILKWRIANYGALPDLFTEKIVFLMKLFLDPFILSGFFAAFLAALSWMAAMTKFDISHAYPFMSLSFILVLILSGLIFNEPITLFKIIGLTLIIIGIAIGSQG